MKKVSATGSATVKQVIIVEDDADLRESLFKFLSLDGYNVVAVGSALEFYRIIAQHSYALAIIDIGLPDQSGIVLAEYIKQNTGMRIIMLTAHTAIEERLASYNAGADVFIVKPADFRELSALVANILGRIGPISDAGSEPEELVLSKDGQQWTILRDGWLLVDPQGKTVKLTLKEFEFLLFLANTRTIAASRQELLKSLEYQNDEYGNRALESLVHRLRRKAAALGSSPIQTAHGVGYSFSAPVSVV